MYVFYTLLSFCSHQNFACLLNISAEAIRTYLNIDRTLSVQEDALHRGPQPLHLEPITSLASQKHYTDAWDRGFIIVNEAGLVSRLGFGNFYSGSVSGSEPYCCGRYRRACLLLEP